MKNMGPMNMDTIIVIAILCWSLLFLYVPIYQVKYLKKKHPKANISKKRILPLLYAQIYIPMLSLPIGFLVILGNLGNKDVMYAVFCFQVFFIIALVCLYPCLALLIFLKKRKLKRRLANGDENEVDMLYSLSKYNTYLLNIIAAPIITIIFNILMIG